EHHLQRAISAQQVFREKKESMVIPVPEAESNVNYYNRLYKGEFKQPKQFIHIQRIWGHYQPETTLKFLLVCFVHLFLDHSISFNLGCRSAQGSVLRKIFCFSFLPKGKLRNTKFFAFPFCMANLFL
ncbi:EPC2 isoform 5, partial [Pan troglodytes]